MVNRSFSPLTPSLFFKMRAWPPPAGHRGRRRRLAAAYIPRYALRSTPDIPSRTWMYFFPPQTRGKFHLLIICYNPDTQIKNTPPPSYLPRQRVGREREEKKNTTTTIHHLSHVSHACCSHTGGTLKSRNITRTREPELNVASPTVKRCIHLPGREHVFFPLSLSFWFPFPFLRPGLPLQSPGPGLSTVSPFPSLRKGLSPVDGPCLPSSYLPLLKYCLFSSCVGASSGDQHDGTYMLLGTIPEVGYNLKLRGHLAIRRRRQGHRYILGRSPCGSTG